MFKVTFLCGIVGAFTCVALAAAVVAPALPLLSVPLAGAPITAVSSQFIHRNYHTTLPAEPALAPAAPLIAAPWSARLAPAVATAFVQSALGSTIGSAALIAPARVAFGANATPLRRFIGRYAVPAMLLTVRRYPAARQRVYRYSSYY